MKSQWRQATQSFRKIYTSHFIWKVCVWEGGGDRTELQHTDLPSPSGHSRVSFPFSRATQPEARGPSSLLDAGFLYHILSPTGLVSKLTGLVSKLVWSPELTDFLSSPSYIIVQSPTQYLPITGHRDVSLPLSLEWHVWLSSIGNNCHTVHRRISLTVPWDFTLSHIVSQARIRQWNLQLPRLWNGMFCRVEGQYTTPLLVRVQGPICNKSTDNNKPLGLV